jgi:hypothetical protein
MTEGSVSRWNARLRSFWRALRRDPATQVAAELDRKPTIAFWLHLRGFVSLVREIISR